VYLYNSYVEKEGHEKWISVDGSSGNNKADNISPKADTTYYFIKHLLNQTPKQVVNKLGNADSKLTPTNDCTYIKDNCTTTTYQNGKYKCFYYHNILKMFEIKGGFPFDANSIILVGLPFLKKFGNAN